MTSTSPPINQPKRLPEPPEAFDPLRFCIFTTIALVAWVITPPAAVVWTSGMGLWAYGRARRAGLVKSRCVLGDTRLVMAYLALAFVGGAVALGFRVAGWF
ncbi:MAG: hypothetical protein R3290_03255 [Acidimicrobiia bacterium]|nr:hypothetical protein [Acidimicrobiia bacterium]